MQQGAFYEGSSLGTAVSSTTPTPAAPTLAAANEVRTY
jgi:hypothetical protein